MTDRIKSKVMIIVVILFITAFAVLKFILPYEDYSYTERRRLAVKPELTVSSVLNGNYGKKLENYNRDHFPLREGFRKTEALSSLYLFNKRDDKGLFLDNGYIYKVEYPLNYHNIEYALYGFNRITERYLYDGNKAYISVIPDKNAFSDGLKMDYNEFENVVKKNCSFAEYIKISDLLEAEDYYYTDPHWKQENLIDVAQRISKAMGKTIDSDFVEKEVSSDFKGAYSGQLPLKSAEDSLIYLWKDIMNYYRVFNIEKNREVSLYNLDKINSRDLYEIYLDGPSSIISIENPDVEEKDELIVFRDSFGSSIGPLLVENYSKITFVDVRYISWTVLDKFIDFKDADMLFLYSTSVLNNSETLKF